MFVCWGRCMWCRRCCRWGLGRRISNDGLLFCSLQVEGLLLRSLRQLLQAEQPLLVFAAQQLEMVAAQLLLLLAEQLLQPRQAQLEFWQRRTPQVSAAAAQQAQLLGAALERQLQLVPPRLQALLLARLRQQWALQRQ